MQRPLSFARHLPAFGWTPVVLTARPSSYPDVSAENLRLLPPDLEVIRAGALDAARHLSFRGKYPQFAALPDRWQTWAAHGTLAGLRAIGKHRPRALLSTFPIATAHVIAYLLSRMTGLPWIADFRDPMLTESHPPPGRVRNVYAHLEGLVARRADALLVTTQGAAEYFIARYGNGMDKKLFVIENGFEEETFRGLSPPPPHRPRDAPLDLLHSGLLYPEGRNPAPFMAALAQACGSGADTARFRVCLRNPGSVAHYQSLIRAHGLQDIVAIGGALPYREALQEMCNASVLLLFQGASFNRQIPAKLYEYLYTGAHILALTDPRGDTARLVRQWDNTSVVPMTDVDAIAATLESIAQIGGSSSLRRPRPNATALSRRMRTKELAAVLDQVALPRMGRASKAGA